MSSPANSGSRNFVSERNQISESFAKEEIDEEIYTFLFIHSLNEEALLHFNEGGLINDVLDEECRRLHLPLGSRRRIIAAAAADAAREQLDKSAPRFSRNCVVCLTESPCQRSFFKECGHVTCRACAEQLEYDAQVPESIPSCPLCRKLSKIQTLIEENDKNYDEFVARNLDTAKRLIVNTAPRGESTEYRDLLILNFLTTHIDKESFSTMYYASLLREARHRGIASKDVHKEELQRFSSDLPGPPYYRALHELAATALYKRQMPRLINHLKNENERRSQSVIKYSRACLTCPSQHPRHRSVFTDCGHLVCRECAGMMTETMSDPLCPICKVKSPIINLFEDLIET